MWEAQFLGSTTPPPPPSQARTKLQADKSFIFMTFSGLKNCHTFSTVSKLRTNPIHILRTCAKKKKKNWQVNLDVDHRI